MLYYSKIIESKQFKRLIFIIFKISKDFEYKCLKLFFYKNENLNTLAVKIFLCFF